MGSFNDRWSVHPWLDEATLQLSHISDTGSPAEIAADVTAWRKQFSGVHYTSDHATGEIAEVKLRLGPGGVSR